MRQIAILCGLCLLITGAAASAATRSHSSSTSSTQAEPAATGGLLQTAQAAHTAGAQDLVRQQSAHPANGRHVVQAIILGSQALSPKVQNNFAGSVDAFPFRARRNGSAKSIRVYVGARTSATRLFAGLYSNTHGAPHSLLSSGVLHSPVGAAWNSVPVRATSLRSGTTYWLALLGEGGAIYFRDRQGLRCTGQRSSKRGFRSLPRTWFAGPTSPACRISAYVKGTVRAPTRAPTKVFGPNAPATTPPSSNGTTGSAPLGNAPTAPSGATITLPPIATGAPAIAGNPLVGLILTASNGSWINSPTSYDYRWEDCDALGLACTAIADADSSSYLLTESDLGHTIRAEVTATNAGGATSATSAQTATVALPPPPANRTLPTISGEAVEGQTLATTNGTWTNNPRSYAYQWQDCAAGCSNISDATNATYTLRGSDLGYKIDVVVTATNAGGSAPATSAQTGSVSAPAPPPVAAFALSPSSPVVGQAVNFDGTGSSCSATPCTYLWNHGTGTATFGTAATATYTYQGTGVKTPTLTVTDALGQTSTVEHDLTVSSAGTAAPTNTSPPTITGTPQQSDSLDAWPGSWTNSPTSYGYQWQDCVNGTCQNIPGATSPSYTLQNSDVGSAINVVVTATNAGGATSAISAQTAAVTTGGGGASAPANTVAPYFTASVGATSCTAGCALQGQQLTVTTGTWSNNPTSYSYQWKDCATTSAQPPTTGSCSNATGPGATTPTYTVSVSDVGKSLVPIVTATNGGGSTSTTISGSRCDTGETPWVNPTLAYNDSARVALSGPIVAGAGCSPISAQVGTTQIGGSHPELFCSNAPTTCGYGDPLAGTVGVPFGTSLTTVGSLTLSSSGCSGLGSPSWCSGAGTAGNPWVVNSVSTPHIDVHGGYWLVKNSQVTYNGAGCAVVCVYSGSTLTLLDSTITAPNNTANGFSYGVDSEYGGSVTLNGVYTYNGQRILQGAGTFENSFCYENASQAGAHLECWYGGSGENVVSTNNVLVQPWGQTTNFDGGSNQISSNDDLLIGGGGYNFYPGPPCETDNVTNDRFSRFYWSSSGEYGVDYDPGCATMTWTGNVWDDTGAAVANG